MLYPVSAIAPAIACRREGSTGRRGSMGGGGFSNAVFFSAASSVAIMRRTSAMSPDRAARSTRLCSGSSSIL